MSKPELITFALTSFLLGSPSYHQLPQDQLPEVAIAGRSNAGKSTLINNLTHQNKLARTSQTPGKTREINLFNLYQKENKAPLARLVDLPGYGYAKVAKKTKELWQAELTEYLMQRPNLQILIIVLDSRMEPTQLDLLLIEMASKRNIEQIFIFNKVDKLNQSEKVKLHRHAQQLTYQTPNSSYLTYASPKNIGREALQRTLNALLLTKIALTPSTPA